MFEFVCCLILVLFVLFTLLLLSLLRLQLLSIVVVGVVDVATGVAGCLKFARVVWLGIIPLALLSPECMAIGFWPIALHA